MQNNEDNKRGTLTLAHQVCLLPASTSSMRQNPASPPMVTANNYGLDASPIDRGRRIGDGGSDTHKGGDNDDDEDRGEEKGTENYEHVSLAETARMFTLICSNDEERHAVITTFRHQFRLDLQAVMKEGRNPRCFDRPHQDGGGGGECRWDRAIDNGITIDVYGQSSDVANLVQSSKNLSSCSPARSHLALGSPCMLPETSTTSNVDSVHSNCGSPPAANKQSTIGNTALLSEDLPTGDVVRGVERGGRGGISVEEFTEALMRCPSMVEAFGNHLAARLRHRHRPAWMAPILRTGASGGI